MRRRRASAVVLLVTIVLAAPACSGPSGPDATTTAATSDAGPSDAAGSGSGSSPGGSSITPSRTAPPPPATVGPEPPSPAPPATSPAPTAVPAPPELAPPEPAPPEPAPPPSSVTAPSALLGSDWERIPTQDQVVALTFDGGSSDAAVGSILATLADRGVLATFFVTGEFARRYPGQVTAMAAGGHRLGNHSDTHEHYPVLTNAEISADLAAAHTSISAAGPDARPWFRFPYGDRTTADIRAVNDAGYVPIRWTVDTLGWKGTSGGLTATAVTDRVLATAQPGQIVLMHVGANPDDGTTLDADALPAIVDGLRARGYAFVTLDRMLG